MFDIIDYIDDASDFIGEILFPVLFGVAFLVFAVNAFRYFFFGKDDEQKRETTKRLALYSVLAFVFILIIWGVVNMITSGLRIGDEAAIQPDYLESQQRGGGFINRPLDGGDSFFDSPFQRRSR